MTSMTRREAVGATSAAALAATLPGVAFAAKGKPPYQNAALPVSIRVGDLLARMTLEEKAAQLCCMWESKRSFQDERGEFSPDRAATALKNGIGQISRPGDIRGFPEWSDHPFRSIGATVRQINQIQRFLVERTRLGIPALFHDELAHGLLAGDATIFPIAPALASTWDPDLVEQVYTVAAREARARGTTLALTPVLDLARDPRFGRVEEFFGEDPHLVSRMAVAAVRGLQGRQRPLAADRVYATLKHFVHAVPAGGLNISPADISERALRENFLVPFEKVVAEADPAVIMPSYNEIMGVPSHANGALLQATGRKRLGFKGAYFSDYEGIANLAAQHHVAGNRLDAAAMAITAGVGADLPEGNCYVHLPELVRSGRVSEAHVDDAVARILALKFEAGLFEQPFVSERPAKQAAVAPTHVALARQAAEKALILLKNDGLLPLDPARISRLAVIGPNAVEPLFGGYSGDTPHAVGILDGIRAAAPAGLRVDHAEGVRLAPPDAIGRHRSYSPTPPVPAADDDARIAEAVALARSADVVLLVLGDIPAFTREAVDWTLPGDRSTLGLMGRQDALVEAILATGKPVVALLLNGRALAVERLTEGANALLEGWYLGQESGNAFADVLFGKASPGGKLTVSIPRAVGELPVYYNRHPSADVNHYIERPRAALFPFGHGLSYTTFAIAAPRLLRAQIARGETAIVEVNVTNTGHRVGDEVVQVYIRDEIASVPRPVLELRAFQRVTLQPGEARTLRFELGADDLAFWDIDMNWTVEPGEFTIFAGNSSQALKSEKLVVT